MASAADRTDGSLNEVAEKLGAHPESVRNWVRQDAIDVGERPGLTSDDKARIAELERDSAELRRANERVEILRGVRRQLRDLRVRKVWRQASRRQRQTVAWMPFSSTSLRRCLRSGGAPLIALRRGGVCREQSWESMNKSSDGHGPRFSHGA